MARAPSEEPEGLVYQPGLLSAEEEAGLLERLKDGLTDCIGCGCLSLGRCQLANPGDRAAARGPGPRYWIGDPRD